MNGNPRNSNGNVYYNDSNNGNLSVYRYSNSLLNDSTFENNYNEAGNLNALNTAFYGPENESTNEAGNEEEDVGNRLLPDEINLNATLPTGGRRTRRVRKRVVKSVAKRLVKNRKSRKAMRKATRKTTRRARH